MKFYFSKYNPTILYEKFNGIFFFSNSNFVPCLFFFFCFFSFFLIVRTECQTRNNKCNLHKEKKKKRKKRKQASHTFPKISTIRFNNSRKSKKQEHFSSSHVSQIRYDSTVLKYRNDSMESDLRSPPFEQSATSISPLVDTIHRITCLA